MYAKFRLLFTSLKFRTVEDYLDIQNDDPLLCLVISGKFPTPSQLLKIKKDSWYFIKIRVRDPSFSMYAKFPLARTRTSLTYYMDDHLVLQ